MSGENYHTPPLCLLLTYIYIYSTEKERERERESCLWIRIRHLASHTLNLKLNIHSTSHIHSTLFPTQLSTYSCLQYNTLTLPLNLISLVGCALGRNIRDDFWALMRCSRRPPAVLLTDHSIDKLSPRTNLLVSLFPW